MGEHDAIQQGKQIDHFKNFEQSATNLIQRERKYFWVQIRLLKTNLDLGKHLQETIVNGRQINNTRKQKQQHINKKKKKNQGLGSNPNLKSFLLTNAN